MTTDISVPEIRDPRGNLIQAKMRANFVPLPEHMRKAFGEGMADWCERMAKHAVKP